MLKSGVLCRWVNKISKAELFDVTEPLKPGVFDNAKNQLTRNFDKTVNGVVDYFLFVQEGTVIFFNLVKNWICKDIAFCGQTMRLIY